MRKIMTLVLLLALPVSGQAVLYTINGDSPGDHLGFSTSSAGDVNGDGFADLIIGAAFDDNNGGNSGSARVVSGATGSVLFTFNGDSVGDHFGNSVSGAGDVNGDGFPDLIVGAFAGGLNGGGYARVFSGVNGSTLYTFNGDSASDQFGVSVSGAGDVDGDGLADLIVGANLDDNNGIASGSARVFSGGTGSVLHTFNGDSAIDEFGGSVSGAGDVDGDGLADLIVGARFDNNNGPSSGSARVFSGLSGSALYTFNGDQASNRFGISVADAGDVNGDGFGDLIVGALAGGLNGGGFARVFSGLTGLPSVTFDGDSTGDAFGASVSGAGDVNGDGFADLIVGAYFDDNNGSASGSARVFSGVNGSALFTVNGDSAGDWFGLRVSGAGDVNGDGLADVIVGASDDDNNGTDSGSARVFLGGIFGSAGSLTLCAPSSMAICNIVQYTLTAVMTQPLAPYAFEVSFTGTSPGLPLPLSLQGPFPLNPPFLNITFGAALPSVFNAFSGNLNALGQAGPAVYIPNVPFLVGLTLSAAGLTLDPNQPFGIGLISNGVQTLITP